jgi:hypothetical protein
MPPWKKQQLQAFASLNNAQHSVTKSKLCRVFLEWERCRNGASSVFVLCRGGFIWSTLYATLKGEA